ncbi:DUF29 domain-containing protein [Floridanema evergladense]|uniref:DUF29 domain-containing protein n=1 Tax=Floridaenema evergladense BLCC-F167 TaxID=3153639 RepID=A0ABV4WLT7_9CYAN
MNIKPSEDETINLYETDFYAWTQKQVELLRQHQLDCLDIENLIEEIDSLGKQQQQELVNRLGVLLGHLLKWEYQPSKRSRSWVATIREQRRKIAKLLQKNPSLKPYLEEAIQESYPDGVDLAVRETLMEYRTFPSEVSYTWQQIESPDFLPGLLSNSDKDLLN